MMIHRPNPTIEVPLWSSIDDPTAHISRHLPVSGITVNAGDFSPYETALAALQLYSPHNDNLNSPVAAGSGADEDSDSTPVDAYSCDEFRMYEFKVRRCNRSRSHDWTECPYAHAGEKARRRDPRTHGYSGAPCPDYRKGACKHGDACEYAHGVFECWLHPSRYRTQPCKDGSACRRRVCFFAHAAYELRSPAPETKAVKNASSFGVESYDGSPLRQRALVCKGLLSPESPPESPPLSPDFAARRRAAVSEVVASLRQLQLSKAASTPSSWKLGSGVFGSPRAAGVLAGFSSLPATPTSAGGVWSDSGDEAVERVESGRALRAKLFEKLCKDNGVERTTGDAPASAPDVAWISELVK